MEKSGTWLETGVGALVLFVALGFLSYGLTNISHSSNGRGYELIARFGDVGALSSGADVRVAGVKVGTVGQVELDPKAYLAKVHILMDKGIKLPTDSTAKISSTGLLGGQLVAIAPGGALSDMQPGAEFTNTQGAVDIFGLIGQVVRGQPAETAQPPPSSKSSTPAKPSDDGSYPG